MRNPGLSGTSVRKGIRVRNAFVLGNVLPGLEMPPDVRIGDIARRHGEEAEEQHCQEDAFYGEPPVHTGLIIAGRQLHKIQSRATNNGHVIEVEDRDSDRLARFGFESGNLTQTGLPTAIAGWCTKARPTSGEGSSPGAARRPRSSLSRQPKAKPGEAKPRPTEGVLIA